MKIKSLSIIIMLALCLTISGVYATWTYAEADVADVTGTASLTINTAAIGDAAGTLAIDTSALTMEIVDTDGDHTTKLEATGTVKITFTPNPDTDKSEVPTAFTWAISATDAALAATHGTDKVLTSVDTTAQNITLNADNSYTVTVEASEIAALIDLNEIVLETAAEHAEYKTVIEALDAFTITVSAK